MSLPDARAGKAEERNSATDNPIRICFVCTHSFTLATLYKGLFPYLESKGYRIAAVVGDDEYRDFDPEQFGKLRPVIIPMRRKPSPIADFVALWRLFRFFSRQRYDIVHVSTPKASLLGSVAAKLAGCRNVVFVYRRCVYELMTGWRRRLYRGTDKIICSFSDLVIPISRQISRFLIEERVAPASKVQMVSSGSSNGVDVNRFRPGRIGEPEIEELRASLRIDADAPVLLFVGRVCGEKGVDLLPKVIDAVRQEHPGAVLVVAGPEDARDPPSGDTKRRFDGDPAIRRLGYLQDPSPLYALSALFVFPSYFEGFGNVLLEAAAHERVSVAFDVPGVQEAVVDGETGILTAAGDVDGMSRAVCHLLTHRVERERMQRQARQRAVTTFANEVVWAALDSRFRALACRRGLARRSARDVHGSEGRARDADAGCEAAR